MLVRSRNIVKQRARCWGYLCNIEHLNMLVYNQHIRAYSLQKNSYSEDMQSWVKDTSKDSSKDTSKIQFSKKQELLDDFVTSYTSQKSSNMESTVSDSDFGNFWKTRFLTGELKLVEEVINLRRSSELKFNFNQLMILLQSLKNSKRFYEINQLYKAYYADLENLQLDPSDKTYREFLKIIILAASKTNESDIVENLFRIYIKYPAVEARYITIGMKAMLQNNNYIMARQFYNYMLLNQETFPLVEEHLRTFLKHTIKNNDLVTLKEVFKRWVDEANKLPSYKTIAGVHIAFLKFNCNSGEQHWEEIKLHPKILGSGYNESDYRIVAEFVLKVYNNSWPENSILTKLNELLQDTNPEVSARGYLYLLLLRHFADICDFGNLKGLLSMIQSDVDIKLGTPHHYAACTYFVKNGLLQDLMLYLKTFLIKSPTNNSMNFTAQTCHQIWTCSMQAYPMLYKEFENEFKLLYSNSWYRRTFPWLEATVNNLVTVSHPTSGDKIMYRRSKDNNDSKILSRVESHINRGKLGQVRRLITNQMKLGIKPSFKVYYYLLRYCVDSGNKSLAKFLNSNLRLTYSKIPLTVEIVNLRIRLYEIMKDGVAETQCKISAIHAAQREIVQFIKDNEACLDFENHMQLALLCSRYHIKNVAEQLLLRGKDLMDIKNKKQVYVFYRTAFMVYVRQNAAEKFLHAIKEHNSLSEGKLITKYFIALTKRHINCLHSKGADEKIFNELRVEQEKLRIAYAANKLEGLEKMLELTKLLRAWLDDLVYHKQKYLLEAQKKKINQKQLHCQNQAEAAVQLPNTCK
ncbi:HGR057Cp [Eremothecium sinecaudum]|uniref:HGR057Cp n=1 Tax=Eremothecium sinecaudum TaxID=45286 RepID=A0A120K2S1_9SACH|nr:HGR057Cp [Eremothecium sinecaudum]AMD22396.1 HGR057Cp [Eremothecium sinecaudum]